MIQYFLMDTLSVRDQSTGQVIRVKDFRQRVQYDDSSVFIGKVEGKEPLRMDLLSNRVYGDQHKLRGIIDANEKDIFSFSLGEAIRFVSGDLI